MKTIDIRDVVPGHTFRFIGAPKKVYTRLPDEPDHRGLIIVYRRRGWPYIAARRLHMYPDPRANRTGDEPVPVLVITRLS